MSEVHLDDLLAAGHDAAVEHGDPVLTYLDVVGRPASVRVKVEQAADGLDVALPEGAPPPADGPANLLAHSHDDELWDLQQTMVRGRLRVDGEAARFLPDKVVPGARPGLRNAVRTLRRCRRSAASELDRRGLDRPAVPWDVVKRIAGRVDGS
jgi:hypothetical protein